MTRRIEARSLHVIVSSDHSLANEPVAEAVARVLSRYAIDFTPGVKINVPHDGDEVTYMASAPKSFSSYQRAARTASRRLTKSQR